MLITPSVELPDEALQYHLVGYGKTRTGKTYAIKGIIEKLLDRGRRVCVIDPTGVWWGMKSPGDGPDAKGYPFVIFGGRHADVPITEHAAASLAELVGTRNVPAIIDLQLMTVGQRTRFMTKFADEIYRLNRGALHLILDEAHMFAPKNLPSRGRKGEDDENGNPAMMLHNVLLLATGGGVLGFRIMALSQRPAQLHNTMSSQCETIIAMRVIAPSDREAVREWIDGCGDPVKGKEVLASLAQLKRGEGWVWSPDNGVLARTMFPKIRSFDSSATPDDSGEVAAPASVTEVDLAPIRAAMAAVVEEAEDSDVKSLRKKVKDLQRRLDAALLTPATVHPADVDRQLEEAKASGAAAAAIHARDIAGHMVESLAGIGSALTALIKDHNRLTALGDVAGGKAYLNGSADHGRDNVRLRGAEAPGLPDGASDDRADRPGQEAGAGDGGAVGHRGQAAGDAAAGGGRCGRDREEHAEAGTGAGRGRDGPHQRILNAIDWWRAIGVAAPSRHQVAFVAGYTASSGTFRNYLSELSSRGAIHYPDAARVALTPAGARSAAAPQRPPTLAELHARIRAKLSNPQQRIFDILVVQAKGAEMPRTSVAELAGYEVTSGTFRNYMAELSTLGLIRYPRKTAVQASPLIFPEALCLK